MSGRWPPPPLPNTGAVRASELHACSSSLVVTVGTFALTCRCIPSKVGGVGGAGEGRFMPEQDGRAADGCAPAQLLQHAPATQAAAQLLVCA